MKNLFKEFDILLEKLLEFNKIEIEKMNKQKQRDLSKKVKK